MRRQFLDPTVAGAAVTLDTPDPTAGERARLAWSAPDGPIALTDPTDPEYGRTPLDALEDPVRAGVIFDPTDPRHV